MTRAAKGFIEFADRISLKLRRELIMAMIASGVGSVSCRVSAGNCRLACWLALTVSPAETI